MRLTLRTLLAYLDDILDPADREVLAKKIETSEFANDLIHRTLDTTRRLRLSAPQPLGTGMALDPNTVAEYLDNVLPPDGVGDFERICLESDLHLAEVASCHHVLTMVLGEPAAVDPEARQRMYTIASDDPRRQVLRLEPAHGPSAAAVAATPAGLASAVQSSPVHAPAAGPVAAEIPDYLRASRWAHRRGPLAVAALVLVLMATAYFAFGLKDWFAGQQQSATVATNDMAAPLQPPTPSISEPSPNDQPAADARAADMDPDRQAAATDQPGPSLEAPPMPAAPPPLLTPGLAPPAAAAVESVGAEQVAPSDAVESNPEGAAPVNRVASVAIPPQQPFDADRPPPIEPSPTTMPAAATEGASSPDGATGDAPVGTDAGSADDRAADAPAEPDTTLGTYLGGKSVLVRWDEPSGNWLRCEPRSTVGMADKLLALPAFRPRITLDTGVSLELVGGTLVRLTTTDALKHGMPAPGGNLPVVEVIYGRVVLVNAMGEDNRVKLAFGPSTGEAQLAPNATLAVEVVRRHVPGVDPRQASAPIEVRLFAPDGNVAWTDAAGTRAQDAPGQWVIADGAAADTASVETTPVWMDSDPDELLSELRLGAPELDRSIDYGSPVDDQLLELFQGTNRKEVKSLAARGSVHVGLFVPFVEALRDSEQKTTWKMHIETLRAAMALSPDSAEQIWQTLVAQRGQRAAAALYEMLCGYNADQIGHTEQQVETGAIADLIDRLEDDNLDYRVLAVHNLREITGKTLMTNPAGTPNEREQGIRRWRARLKAGELGPPPEPGT